MRGLLIALGALALAAPVGAQTFTGTTTLTSPTFNRTLSGSPPTTLSAAGVGVHYNLLPFTVTLSGNYAFELVGITPAGWDTFLGLYSGSFNPASPLANVLYADDDSGPGSGSAFTASLLAGTSYFGVITGFDSADVGAWSLSISGPGVAVPSATAVPEPVTWAMLTLGFGLVGGAMRRRSLKVSYAV